VKVPIHPDVDTLFSHWDGSLEPARSEALAAHLDACDECHLKFHRLKTTWSAALDRAFPEGAPSPPGLADVLSGIQAWEARSATEESRAGIKQGVGKEIGLYLGKKAACRILGTVSEDGRDLLPAIEPVLALFLGQRAAFHLVSHVVDVAIVRL
jgi:hypothetical protein